MALQLRTPHGSDARSASGNFGVRTESPLRESWTDVFLAGVVPVPGNHAFVPSSTGVPIEAAEPYLTVSSEDVFCFVRRSPTDVRSLTYAHGLVTNGLYERGHQARPYNVNVAGVTLPTETANAAPLGSVASYRLHRPDAIADLFQLIDSHVQRLATQNRISVPQGVLERAARTLELLERSGAREESATWARRLADEVAEFGD